MNESTIRYSVGYDFDGSGWCVMSSAGTRVSELRTRKAQAERDFYHFDAKGVSWKTRDDAAIMAKIKADRA